MKYAQAYITSKQTAVVVAQTLWENFLVHYGWSEKILTDQGKSFENNIIKELCELAQLKKLHTSPYHPETNGQCEHFNTTLINMLGTLLTHAKRNWQEWITTLTQCLQLHCFFSDRVQFLLFDVRTNPKNTLRYRNGGNIDGPRGSCQNYVKELKARLEWAYQVVQENNQKESKCHKKYYDKRMRCMSLKPDDFVLVHAKAPSGDHKIAD